MVRQILHGPRLQPKLSVGPPDDAYEREADRVAEAVMRIPEPAVEGESSAGLLGAAAASPAHPAIQRLCPECEEMQRKSTSSFAIGERIGSGSPLPPSERAFFEPRLGIALDEVRLHTGSAAAGMARSVNARAFTVGRSIVFGEGEHRPGTADGRKLLAHELTHVVQQGGAPGGAPPMLRRWSISGDTATSDSNGDTLWGLAKSITGKGFDWMCIRPVAMKSKKAKGKKYPYFVRIGDEFDISNLNATTGTSLSIHLFDPTTEALDAALAVLFYPGSTSSLGPDGDIEGAASFGATPIQAFVIFGHSGGNEMWGGAGSFRPSEFNPHDPNPTFEQAEGGFLPRRCWFTRTATARSVGCDSNHFGEAFARAYLRNGASIVTTTAAVQPKCTGTAVDISQTPPGCKSYQGVAFATSHLRTAAMIEGEFWSAADFHAGTHWVTIAGKL